MKYENLTKENLVEIIRLYEEHCGLGRDFQLVMHQGSEGILSHLKRNSGVEYRIGSRWDSQSKIFF